MDASTFPKNPGTTLQVAAVLRCGPDNVRRLVRAGRLKVVHVGHIGVLDLDEAAELAERRKKTA